MKIVIDLTSLSYHMTGIERYAACMTESMIENDSFNDYVLFFRNEIYPSFNKFIDKDRVKAIILKGNNKVFFLQVILPIELYKIKADKYFFFAFTSPIIFKRKGIINTIHDMGAWDSSESMTFFQKIYWQTTYKFSARVSERILTVSEFSKHRINKILKYPKERISVIYSAVSKNLTKNNENTFEEIKDKYSLPTKYIMTLSTLEPRKNIQILLKAFSNVFNKVEYDLVLVGRMGWKMEEIINQYKSKDRIHVTGFVEDEHVSEIYRNAMCFVFPSTYEGFGLPPVEALALGTPVISSNAASLPEILMDQAVYFNSQKIEELEKKLLKLEKEVESMPCCLNQFQQENYSFEISANKILKIIGV